VSIYDVGAVAFRVRQPGGFVATGSVQARQAHTRIETQRAAVMLLVAVSRSRAILACKLPAQAGGIRRVEDRTLRAADQRAVATGRKAAIVEGAAAGEVELRQRHRARALEALLSCQDTKRALCVERIEHVSRTTLKRTHALRKQIGRARVHSTIHRHMHHARTLFTGLRRNRAAPAAGDRLAGRVSLSAGDRTRFPRRETFRPSFALAQSAVRRCRNLARRFGASNIGVNYDDALRASCRKGTPGQHEAGGAFEVALLIEVKPDITKSWEFHVKGPEFWELDTQWSRYAQLLCQDGGGAESCVGGRDVAEVAQDLARRTRRKLVPAFMEYAVLRDRHITRRRGASRFGGGYDGAIEASHRKGTLGKKEAGGAMEVAIRGAGNRGRTIS